MTDCQQESSASLENLERFVAKFTHTLGNTRVIPPSVDAKTARKPYLKTGKCYHSSIEHDQHPPCSQHDDEQSVMLQRNVQTHEFKSLFFQTREASCPMILESKIRLWTRPRSPATPGKDKYLMCTCVTIAALTRLTFIRVERNIEHEREEVLQKLSVIVGNMQTFAVFSGEKRGQN